MGRATRTDEQDWMPKGFRVGPFVVIVMLVAALAGVLVAGVPGTSAPVGVRLETAAADAPASTNGVPVADEQGSDAAMVGDVTAETATTTAPTTTEIPSTTAAPTTTSSTTTTTSTTSTTVPEPRIDLRVVIANGTDEAGLASRVAAKLESNGYTNTHSTDTASPAEATVIYYATGLKDQAAAVAAVLNVYAPLEPMPSSDITADDSGAAADLLIVFG